MEQAANDRTQNIWALSIDRLSLYTYTESVVVIRKGMFELNNTMV